MVSEPSLSLVTLDGRFRIGWRRPVWKRNFGRFKTGWVIVDATTAEVITIAYARYDEAVLHRDRIALAYERWGW